MPAVTALRSVRLLLQGGRGHRGDKLLPGRFVPVFCEDGRDIVFLVQTSVAPPPLRPLSVTRLEALRGRSNPCGTCPKCCSILHARSGQVKTGGEPFAL